MGLLPSGTLVLGDPGAAGKRCPASDIAFQCEARFGRSEFEPVLPGQGCSCSRDACTHGEGGTQARAWVSESPLKHANHPGMLVRFRAVSGFCTEIFDVTRRCRWIFNFCSLSK